jgi:hypothetical protein
VRLWLSSAECLVDAYVVLLRKLAHGQMVPVFLLLNLCNEILELLMAAN